MIILNSFYPNKNKKLYPLLNGDNLHTNYTTGMLTAIVPKLPMRCQEKTLHYYESIGFKRFADVYEDYLMLEKDQLQIHFFKFENLIPSENYGQIYIRTNAIDTFYHTLIEKKIDIHPNGHLHLKPWGTKEFSLLDPDQNLITFGEMVEY